MAIHLKTNRLFLDCEFNGHKGPLISMALVAEDGREFYEVITLPPRIQPWVRQHVVPVLNKTPVYPSIFRNRLYGFLQELEPFEVIADYPGDIAAFAGLLVIDSTGDYQGGNWTARVYHLVYRSHIPHNALEDARALRLAYLEHLKEL